MEQQLIEYLKKHVIGANGLIIGIGDDAAVLDWQKRDDLVVTADLISDQVDFLLTEVDPKLIGRKALAVNLSDLAAMGAQPVAVIVSLLLPSVNSSFGISNPLDLAIQLYQGIIPLSEKYNVVIAGGDTNTWDGPLAINITAFGSMPLNANQPWRRSDAQAGDVLLVTGELGGSILRHQFEFEPRLAEAALLKQHYSIHAAMDISDGLSLDLSRMCQASGVGVELILDNIPISKDACRLSNEQKDDTTPLQHALSDGEDFELLLAVSESTAESILKTELFKTPIAKIGRFTQSLELIQIDHDGIRTELTPQGFQHQ